MGVISHNLGPSLKIQLNNEYVFLVNSNPRGLGLVVHIPSGYVAKINIP
jgi:hypothetical protein